MKVLSQNSRNLFDITLTKLNTYLKKIKEFWIWNSYNFDATVGRSKILYWAPIWADHMCKEGYAVLEKCLRDIVLKITSAYRKVSKEAALVIAGLQPTDLVEKKGNLFTNESGKEGTKRLPKKRLKKKKMFGRVTEKIECRTQRKMDE